MQLESDYGITRIYKKLKMIDLISDPVGKPKDYYVLNECRICNGKKLKEFLDLGDIPLVNSYVDINNPALLDAKFPLKIQYCQDCCLSQLSVIVRPEIIYKNYAYRSSISKTFIDHCFGLANSAVKQFSLTDKDLVVDIASNDGTALREFKKFGVRVLGVEPAENLAEIARKNGVTTIAEFWGKETSSKIESKYGQASIISAMNVVAHVHDLKSFIKGLDILLKEDGVFIMEVPYLLNFINKNEFDTTYHEHLSYFLVKPLKQVFATNGFDIFDIHKSTIHGGSIRVFVKKKNNSFIKVNYDAIHWLLELENDLGLYDIDTYLRFSEKVIKIKSDLMELLTQLNKKNKNVAAYGASAKGTVLSNYCGVGNNLVQYVVDDTPEKQGFLTPGSRIPIVDFSYLKKKQPDYLLLLAWNFADELMEKTQDYKNAGGKYIVPIPNVRVL